MNDHSINFEIRSVDTEARTVSGVAIPYGETVDVGGYRERIERGAFADTEIGAPLYFAHDHKDLRAPIGKLIEARETDEGLEVKAQISKTPKGEEVYTLLKDGVLKKFSAGFEPVEHRTESDGTVVRTKAKLVEVSIVPRPAYSTANVAEVRSAETINKEQEMSNDNTAPEVELRDVQDAVTNLEREISVIKAGGATSTANPLEVRSFGEFVKGLATGETRDKVEQLNRAFTGATTTDANVQPAWVQSHLRLIQEKRTVLNQFAKAPLPGSGMSVEYPQLATATGTVAEQVNQGDDLTYLEVTLTDASAPVKTYGGYTSLSRQAIERSNVGYVDLVLRHMVNQYARATNGAVRTALDGATTNTATLAADTGQAWIDLIITSSGLVNDNGAEAEFVFMSSDVFARLARIVDSTGRPLFVINGDGANTFGNVNVRGMAGSIAGLPVVVDESAAANTVYVGSSEALTVMESPGAPFKLEDENIINLTKDFSLYGYMAVAVSNPLSIVRVDADLVA